MEELQLAGLAVAKFGSLQAHAGVAVIPAEFYRRKPDDAPKERTRRFEDLRKFQM